MERIMQQQQVDDVLLLIVWQRDNRDCCGHSEITSIHIQLFEWQFRHEHGSIRNLVAGTQTGTEAVVEFDVD